MKALIELHDDVCGAIIAMNPQFITAIRDNKDHTAIRVAGYDGFVTVSESYDEIIRRLKDDNFGARII